MHIILAILLAGTGLAIGGLFPDTDQWLPLVTHRSILTHGFFIPLLLWIIATRRNSAVLRLVVIGFSIAVAVHLAFDLFPRNWYGFALITIPFYGQTGALFSALWLALSTVVSLYLPLRWVADRQDLYVVGACLVLAFVFAGALLPAWSRVPPTIVLGAAGIIALGWAARENAFLRGWWTQLTTLKGASASATDHRPPTADRPVA